MSRDDVLVPGCIYLETKMSIVYRIGMARYESPIKLYMTNFSQEILYMINGEYYGRLVIEK